MISLLKVFGREASVLKPVERPHLQRMVSCNVPVESLSFGQDEV